MKAQTIAKYELPLPMDEIEVYKKSLARERKARQQAELLLESKVRDIYEANQQLEAANAKLKQQQKELIQTEKLASLGTLSAGIAHEINNPLAFIKSNIGTLERYFLFYQQHLPEKTGSQHSDINHARLEKIKFIAGDSEAIFSELREGVDRVQAIVADLKSFARSKSADVQLNDSNEAVLSAIRITNNKVKYHCEIHTDLAELPPIMCNLNELSQVFINLIVNACDAVDENGLITIKSHLEDDFIHYLVEDNGKGISEEDMDKIFTPFYTSKEVGKGTGLGLSVSYGIIESLGGTIRVCSDIGKGTSFHISLPINREPIAAE
ncbi:MAG: ATP-binding protein [Cellvibrionaceae bacterium]|nr:ATP-binding protein [Cellvibrionaceae bacterium]